MEHLSITDFSARFQKIKQTGYTPSLRKGPTGIGYTLETLLGIRENNIATPDILGAELKAHRVGVNSMISLFTFNKKAWVMPQLQAIRQYGSLDRNGRPGLYYTMTGKPNSAGLFLFVDHDTVMVRHISGDIVVQWSLETLAKRFMQKIPALIFVTALVEMRDGSEYFHFQRAQFMTETSPQLLESQFKLENIMVDLRLHDTGTRARNHGTGFRVFEEKLPLLFKKVIDI